MVPLPFELVMKIIEHAYYQHAHAYGFNVDVETLSACAAVCKEWSSFARRLLFLKAQFVRWRVGLFKDPSLLAGPGRLGACIRSLSLQVDRERAGTNFITVLSYCPALYDLELILDTNFPDLTDHEVARLVALPMKIQALSLNVGLMSEESRILYQLMVIWPSVQFLRLNGVQMAPPPAERPLFSLYELSLGSVTRSSEPILRWLLPPIPAGQRGSLHILSLPSNADPNSGALIEYAPYVRSLRQSCRRPPQQEFITRFSALEELVLGDISMDIRSHEAGVPILPRTIQHLRFITFHFFFVRHVPYAIALLDADLPRLKQVSVNGPNASSCLKEDSGLGDLAEVCAKKGVELVYNRHLSPHCWKCEYPVRMDHFPRDWTIENLYRMNTGV